MDCFITTSMAEGWGLTLSEAMCCELPVIYGNHTSFKEIMQGDGKPVKNRTRTYSDLRWGGYQV
jgi:glycosyltransferase involved in cell wall biosynthesis